MYDVVSDCHATASAAKPDKHITRAVAIACTDDVVELYLVDLHLLFCHSSLDLARNQLQQLPPNVFSSLTSLGSLTCVVACIEIVCVHSWCLTSEHMIFSLNQNYSVQEG